MRSARPSPRLLVRADDGRPLVTAQVADSFRQRLRGWIGRAPRPGDGALWLTGVRHVHTFGLKGPIDVLALAADGRLLRLRRRVAPWRVLLGPQGSRHTVELPPGEAARLGLAVGQRLRLVEAPDQETAR